MLILTLRTDKPEAELGLFDDTQQLQYMTWQAHRELAETIHLKLQELLASQQQSLHGLQGIVVYKGPGSFTGLRIGLTVANSLAASLEAHIVATTGDDWLQQGIQQLLNGDNETLAIPEYGALPHITLPKK
jgi:tRNA threonylcarbamoyladenosine biosynthesis protein TsaB